MGVGLGMAAPRRILLVDDIELNRVLTEAVLIGAGYAVECVENGAAAIEAVETKSYDLVLVDLDMPGIDGFRATEVIRQRGDRAELKSVAFSSRTGEAERSRSREVGMDAHIARPIAPPKLIKTIANLVPPAQAGISTVFRPEIQEEIVSRLGAARTRSFLEELLRQCQTILDMIVTGEGMDEAIDRKAHDLASTAGMLGYEDLWHRCRDLLVAEDDFARSGKIGHVKESLRTAIATIGCQLLETEAAAA